MVSDSADGEPSIASPYRFRSAITLGIIARLSESPLDSWSFNWHFGIVAGPLGSLLDPQSLGIDPRASESFQQHRNRP
ncbi:hypothetical protein H4Q26_004535 [Puccinia striiformis f. sp. tritici PST-130]|nr:hypothetical protein H4Q26_004535 [Puccinia striiformis f. sp. tritici PST-130]